MHRIIDFFTRLLSGAWRAYVDDAHFDPEGLLSDMRSERTPPDP